MAQSQDFNRQTGTPVTGAVATSYVDWPAILAGTVLAMALSFVLLTFGSAIGFSVTSFEPHEGASLFWLSVASGLWFIWVAITSFGAGGYIAGRLRRPVAGASLDEVEVRDGAHGLLVWATGAIVGAMLAASGISGAIGAATSTAGTAAQTAAQAVGGDLDVISQRLMRSATGGDPAIESRRATSSCAVSRTAMSRQRIATTSRPSWLSAQISRRKKHARAWTLRSPTQRRSTTRRWIRPRRFGWARRSPPSSWPPRCCAQVPPPTWPPSRAGTIGIGASASTGKHASLLFACQRSPCPSTGTGRIYGPLRSP